MGEKLVTKVLQIEGMTCTSCEMRIEHKLKKTEGIVSAKAIFSSSNVYVTYDNNLINLDDIVGIIENLDYKVKYKSHIEKTVGLYKSKESDQNLSAGSLVGIGLISFSIYFIINNIFGANFVPQVDQNMSLGILFAVGLITSLHCVAMCGGINLSQCIEYKSEETETKSISTYKSSIMYNAGRVISYTLIGGIAGALGSVISFSGTAKGLVTVFSGLFMIVMGLNMLNIFPWLRKINPRMPKIFAHKIYGNKSKKAPFYVGLLNGLMPCGPLQAMQIYALGTGSFLGGAAAMFFFSLGTVPLMFGIGALSTILSGKFTHRMMKVSAVLVLFLGIVMMNRGLSLSGINIVNAAYASSSSSASIAKIENNVQIVTTKLESGRYLPIIVQKGIPVKWTIEATQSDLNGCNQTITIPKYNLTKRLVKGDNIVEFIPTEEGNITYTCWMGMITSNIKVVSDVSNVSSSDIEQNGSSLAPGAMGGCCGIGGF